MRSSGRIVFVNGHLPADLASNQSETPQRAIDPHGYRQAGAAATFVNQALNPQGRSAQRRLLDYLIKATKTEFAKRSLLKPISQADAESNSAISVNSTALIASSQNLATPLVDVDKQATRVGTPILDQQSFNQALAEMVERITTNPPTRP